MKYQFLTFSHILKFRALRCPLILTNIRSSGQCIVSQNIGLPKDFLSQKSVHGMVNIFITKCLTGLKKYILLTFFKHFPYLSFHQLTMVRVGKKLQFDDSFYLQLDYLLSYVPFAHFMMRPCLNFRAT